MNSKMWFWKTNKRVAQLVMRIENYLLGKTLNMFLEPKIVRWMVVDTGDISGKKSDFEKVLN